RREGDHHTFVAHRQPTIVGRRPGTKMLRELKPVNGSPEGGATHHLLKEIQMTSGRQRQTSGRRRPTNQRERRDLRWNALIIGCAVLVIAIAGCGCMAGNAHGALVAWLTWVGVPVVLGGFVLVYLLFIRPLIQGVTLRAARAGLVSSFLRFARPSEDA